MAPSPGEARLRDPAHRDQDGTVWRKDRFAERVRRQWNPVQLGDEALQGDLDALATAIQARVGGAVEPIKERLLEFERMEAQAAAPAMDPLVRPGAPAA